MRSVSVLDKSKGNKWEKPIKVTNVSLLKTKQAYTHDIQHEKISYSRENKTGTNKKTKTSSDTNSAA